MSETVDARSRRPGYRHVVGLYDGDEAFLDATAPFVREGVEAGEVVLVALAPTKIEWLRDALGRDSAAVRFVDMQALGSNPGTLIPVWRDFVDEHAPAGRAVRGVGEPVWPERSSAAVAECHHHEALLNVAFPDDPDFALLCPYDTRTLAPEVLDGALARHPYPADRPAGPATRYRPAEVVDATLTEPLPPPPSETRTLTFTVHEMRGLRALVRAEALARGLGTDRCDDLVLAVTEVAANSIRHGPGWGTLRVWHEGGHLVCEVTDGGRIRDPLVGRRRPDLSPGCRGLWLVHHLCDLVQLRSTAAGTVVRLHAGTDA